VLRAIEKRLDRAHRSPPVWLRYFVLEGAILLFLLTAALYSIVVDIMLPSEWLDPKKTKEFVKNVMHGDHEVSNFADWEEEASLKDYELLRALSLTSPAAVVATWVVVSCHVFLHAKQIHNSQQPTAHRYGVMNEGPEADCLHEIAQRSKTIRILFLPMVYGLMSLQGVARMWAVTINHVGGSRQFYSWESRKAFLEDMYEAAFCVADFYESYTLFLFGLLILQIVKNNVDAHVINVRRETDLSPAKRTSSASLDGLEHSVTLLMAQTKGLTILGVKLFCMTCAGQSIYQMVTCNANYYHGYELLPFSEETVKLLESSETRHSANLFIKGGGFIASFAAIGNLIEVERGFHQYMLSFKPLLKFVGTKILVSIAFMQQIGLSMIPPFSSWTPTRINLLYSSILTWECFLICLLHLSAWGPLEDWFKRACDTPRELERISTSS